MGTSPRTNAAPLKVIGVGLGRTGTTSLRAALGILGFGPCYHMVDIIAAGGKDYPTWCKIGDGNGTAEDFDNMFQNYHSVTDVPASMYPAELYAAYPDAKFILSTRDPAKWETSMKRTVMRVPELMRAKENKTGYEPLLGHWNQAYLQDKYHRGRLEEHAQQELLDHNERVKQIIPPEKLLVYEVGEGWDRLAEFLGVPIPTEPYPHVNDSADFPDIALHTGKVPT